MRACVCGGGGGYGGSSGEQRQSIISGMLPVHGALDYLRELAIDQQSESAGQPPLASQQYCHWLRPPRPPLVGLMRFGGHVSLCARLQTDEEEKQVKKKQKNWKKLQVLIKF